MSINALTGKPEPKGAVANKPSDQSWRRGDGLSFRVNPDGSIGVRMVVDKVLGADGKPSTQTFEAIITAAQYKAAKPKTEPALATTGTTVLDFTKAVVGPEAWTNMQKPERQALYDKVLSAVVDSADKDGYHDAIRFVSGKRAGNLRGKDVDMYVSLVLGREKAAKLVTETILKLTHLAAGPNGAGDKPTADGK